MVDIVEKAKAKNKVIGTFTDDYSMVENGKAWAFSILAIQQILVFL